MASIAYNRAKYLLFKALRDGGVAPTFKVALLNPSYTPDPDHNTMADVSAYEVNGTGYVAGPGGSGRKTLTVTLSEDDAGDRAVFDLDDQSWTGADGWTVKYAVIYLHASGSNEALNELLFLIQLPETTTIGVPFVITWNSLGVVHL